MECLMKDVIKNKNNYKKYLYIFLISFAINGELEKKINIFHTDGVVTVLSFADDDIIASGTGCMIDNKGIIKNL